MSASAENALGSLLPEDVKAKLDEEVELARGGLSRFDPAAYREGNMTPVYFGSALKRFGVIELLDALSEQAPPPRDQAAKDGVVHPGDKDVSGFVFKVQRTWTRTIATAWAFLRLCSGKFRRGMKLKQSGTDKSIGIHNPILFLRRGARDGG
ncbi:MAG: hypothetical protein WDM89_20475 [Rhizomicrobium sp.]